MLVLAACINAESAFCCSADCVGRDHAANSKFHSLFRLCSHECVVADSLQMADPACVMIVELLLSLAACENNVCTVDDDDMVTTVNMRGKGGLVLAAEKNCGLSCNTAERLACSVNYIPFAVNLTSLAI